MQRATAEIITLSSIGALTSKQTEAESMCAKVVPCSSCHMLLCLGVEG